ncbi:MAG: PSD1 and planctomycete cytochrome C domain-containing protein [Fimbriiglobus sp.]|nr:PSD1 and planctomycete cytochrome C domain-containing protein [Fimbriiglobus sp.]
MRSVVALLLLITVAANVGAAGKIDFRRDVRPILAEHCFACHGPDDKARKAKLRLDTREGAMRSIIPGKPADSEFIARLVSKDTQDVMPPPEHKKPLTAKQIATLTQWVEEGAPYDAGHWAFTPPVQGNPGRLGATTHPIDAFIRARLQKEGLTPSPAASPEALVRRIYLDVIGLPPTPTQIDEFIAACAKDRPAAVAALIDRLLASPRYGEKWARHWLDVARYSDSNGYEKDLPREMWVYRDWVVKAFNRDMPYDRFLIEQLAGDLLPNRTQDQLIATGFLRNSMINEEGAVVPEQFRTDEMFDRMDALGKAAFGLTFQCAQCHTHKYDPLTHAEYFGMYAVFNDTYEATSWVYTPEQQATIDTIRAKLAAAEEKIRQARPQWKKEIEAWAAERAKGPTWTPIVATELASTSGLNHPTQDADGTILTLGHMTSRSDIFALCEPPTKGVTGIRFEILTHGDLRFGGPGRSRLGTWALTELEVLAQKPGEKKWEKLKLTDATADWAEGEKKLEDEWASAADKEKKRTIGGAAFAIDGSDLTAWRADRGPGRRHAPSVLVARFEKPLDLPPKTQLKIVWKTMHSGDTSDFKNTQIGCCRVCLTTGEKPAAEPIDYAAVLAARVPAETRTPEQQAALFAGWRKSVPELKAINDEIETLWKLYPEGHTTVLHLAARTPQHHRITKLLDRGAWDKPKQEVKPQTPAVLHKFPDGDDHPRLRFARWVADRNNPLVARVAVNRVWQAIFGVGLVETSEDFGTRAPLPEHPELFDWLAVEFMDAGWSHKKLIKRLLTSETYQQTAKATPQLKERDPTNKLLARGPRFRAEAEVVRDVALAAAGLLHTPDTGGPSIFPPVPASVLDYNYFKPTYWNPPTGPERYRRSLYLFRKRSMPDPLLTTLDAPNGDFACARRVRSNTPLAALVALNEPVFVEAARGLALRVLREGGTTDDERITYAFRLTTGRKPTGDEIQDIHELLKSRKARIADGWLNPREITTGDPAKLPELPKSVTPTDAAAWVLAARVLLNLDETLTK